MPPICPAVPSLPSDRGLKSVGKTNRTLEPTARALAALCHGRAGRAGDTTRSLLAKRPVLDTPLPSSDSSHHKMAQVSKGFRHNSAEEILIRVIPSHALAK